MANMIKAAVFKKRGGVSRDLLESLVVRGGSTRVAEVLKDKFMWNGSTPTACPVFSLGTEDGRITAGRWTLHGKLSKPVRFRAEDVFELADRDLVVSVEVGDLSVFEFGGTSSNFSFWVESKDMKCGVSNRATKEKLRGWRLRRRGSRSSAAGRSWCQRLPLPRFCGWLWFL